MGTDFCCKRDTISIENNQETNLNNILNISDKNNSTADKSCSSDIKRNNNILNESRWRISMDNIKNEDKSDKQNETAIELLLKTLLNLNINEISNCVSNLNIEIIFLPNNEIAPITKDLLSPLIIYNTYKRISHNPNIYQSILNNNNVIQVTNSLSKNFNIAYNNVNYINKINKMELYLLINNVDILNTENIVNNCNSIFFTSNPPEKPYIGIEIKKSGAISMGIWESKNKYNGLKIIEDGTIYSGNFINNLLNGYGKRIKLNGHYNEGFFKDNKQNGIGKEHTDLYEYEGDFVNDEEIGIGTLKFKNGDIYKGDFYKGKFHGKGELIKKKGEKYIGDFFNGKMNGNGTYIWNDKKYYKGEFKNGMKNGNGELHWENGKSFIGNFSNGVPHGKGIYCDGKNVKGKVTFENGVLVNKKGN